VCVRIYVREPDDEVVECDGCGASVHEGSFRHCLIIIDQYCSCGN